MQNQFHSRRHRRLKLLSVGNFDILVFFLEAESAEIGNKEHYILISPVVLTCVVELLDEIPLTGKFQMCVGESSFKGSNF